MHAVIIQRPRKPLHAQRNVMYLHTFLCIRDMAATLDTVNMMIFRFDFVIYICWTVTAHHTLYQKACEDILPWQHECFSDDSVHSLVLVNVRDSCLQACLPFWQVVLQCWVSVQMLFPACSQATAWRRAPLCQTSWVHAAFQPGTAALVWKALFCWGLLSSEFHRMEVWTEERSLDLPTWQPQHFYTRSASVSVAKIWLNASLTEVHNKLNMLIATWNALPFHA